MGVLGGTGDVDEVALWVTDADTLGVAISDAEAVPGLEGVGATATDSSS